MAIFKNTSPIVTNGLVLYLDTINRQSYTPNQNVWLDLSGNTNNGTISNLVTYDNIENGFEIRDQSVITINFPTIVNNITISFVVKVNEIVNNLTVLSKITNTYQINSSQSNYLMFDIVFVNNNNQIIETIYLNSNNIGAATYSDSDFIKSQPITLKIKKNKKQSVRKIFNIKVYNRNLTETEIKQNYNSLKGRYN